MGQINLRSLRQQAWTAARKWTCLVLALFAIATSSVAGLSVAPVQAASLDQPVEQSDSEVVASAEDSVARSVEERKADRRAAQSQRSQAADQDGKRSDESISEMLNLDQIVEENVLLDED